MGNKIFSDGNFHIFIYKCFKLYLKSNRDKRFGYDYGHYLSLCESRQNLEEFIEFYPSFNNMSKLRTELNSDKFDLYGEEIPISDSSKYILTLLDEKELDRLTPRLMLEYMNVINQNSFIRAVSFCVDYFHSNRHKSKDFNDSKIRLFNYFKSELFSNPKFNNELIRFFELIKDKFEFFNFRDGYTYFTTKDIGIGANYRVKRSNMVRLYNCCVCIRNFLETNKLV